MLLIKSAQHYITPPSEETKSRKEKCLFILLLVLVIVNIPFGNSALRWRLCWWLWPCIRGSRYRCTRTSGRSSVPAKHAMATVPTKSGSFRQGCQDLLFRLIRRKSRCKSISRSQVIVSKFGFSSLVTRQASKAQSISAVPRRCCQAQLV
jgi:hypothetical protein